MGSFLCYSGKSGSSIETALGTEPRDGLPGVGFCCRLVAFEGECATVFDARQSSMQDLTSYSPIRVALTGIWRMIFGALLAIPGIALIWIGPNGEPGATRAPGDMPVWWMFVVGLVFAFAAFSFIPAGWGGSSALLPRIATFAPGRKG